mgnify:CR=1 FL=1
MNLKQHIRQIRDFPKPGINFFDISTLIGHAEAWRTAVERMTELVKPWRPETHADFWWQRRWLYRLTAEL